MAKRLQRALETTYKKETDLMASAREKAKDAKLNPHELLTDPVGFKRRIVEHIMKAIAGYADDAKRHGERKARMLVKAAKRRGMK